MDEREARQLIFDNELTCTPTEFVDYYNSIDEGSIVLPSVTSQDYEFSVPFNGHMVSNPTGNPDAIYYVISINAVPIYLQPHEPFVSGFQAITESNKDAIMTNHINHIKDRLMIQEKTNLTIQHFKGT